jgi:short-subunit dehydrogenase
VTATRPLALVTGASSGIGRELAFLLAKDGHDLVLVARHAETLEAVADTVRTRYGAAAQCLVEDLSRDGAARRVVDALGGRMIDVLANNAGFGKSAPFVDMDFERVTDMIRVNVLALTELTRLALPAMRDRGRGRILNVASTAAFQPGPGMAVYYATKAFVLSFSEALHRELKGTGVTSTVVCPGLTETDFHRRAGTRIHGSLALNRMDASRVAREAYAGVKRGARLVIPGAINKSLSLGARVLPRGVALAISAAVTRKMAQPRKK